MTDHIGEATQKVIDLDALEPFAAHCVIYQADTPPMTVTPITTEYRHIRRAFLARNGKGEG